MPKFLVINAETEAHLAGFLKALDAPDHLGRSEMELFDQGNIKRAIWLALKALHAGDPSVTFEPIHDDHQFHMVVKGRRGGGRYRIRVFKER